MRFRLAPIVDAFCGKIKNGSVRHLELVFDPPTKSTYGPEVTQQIWLIELLLFKIS